LHSLYCTSIRMKVVVNTWKTHKFWMCIETRFSGLQQCRVWETVTNVSEILLLQYSGHKLNLYYKAAVTSSVSVSNIHWCGGLLTLITLRAIPDVMHLLADNPLLNVLQIDVRRRQGTCRSWQWSGNLTNKITLPSFQNAAGDILPTDNLLHGKCGRMEPKTNEEG